MVNKSTDALLNFVSINFRDSFIIEELKPDIFFKGGDYTMDQLPEASIVQSYGGEVALMDVVDGFSTTSTIKKMKDHAA